VSRPERAALREAARAHAELAALGIANQEHVINGLLASPLSGDEVAEAFARRQRDAIAGAPTELMDLPTATVPLVAADLTGIDTLRAFVAGGGAAGPVAVTEESEVLPDIPPLVAFIEDLAGAGRGVTMVMGKGGVGKTTIAVAIARGLASRGVRTHLSTTDPAGRPGDVVGESTANLTVSRIDTDAAVAHYVEEKLRAAGDLDVEQRALLEEDLRSPCTEELAVFQAFSNLLRLGRDQHVVVDTAPTGHTLLLLDRTGAYHHDVMRSATTIQGRITTPLMRLRDPSFTRVLLVTLAETTPVHEAAALQDDLRRSGIEPFGWVINATLARSGTRDPVLCQRATLEHRHLQRVKDELAARCWIVPWSMQLSG
jgi:arsenite-transporting ATPase